SEPIDAGEQPQLDQNHLLVARRGREAGLELQRGGRAISLQDWGGELLDQLAGVCELLDAGDPTRRYRRTLDRQAEKLRDAELTPSARLLRELRRSTVGYAEHARTLSEQHRARLLDAKGHEPAVLANFAEEAAASLEVQAALERAERGSFEEYLARTLGPDLA
ncbi:MAG: glutamate--cysteine ligase, partial [Proteobacteria bacterium]|nr:glutamate--cysteine ligase [Pseudomonadota bacterium]